MTELKNATGLLPHNYSVKNLKSGFGHDRAGWQCDLTHNNKIIASVCDDGWGGCLDFIFRNKADEEALEIFCKTLNAERLKHPECLSEYESADNPLTYDRELFVSELFDNALERKESERAEKRKAKHLKECVCIQVGAQIGTTAYGRYERLPPTTENIARINDIHTKKGDTFKILNEGAQ